MASLTVRINSPSGSSTVPRRLRVSGSVSVSGGIFQFLDSVEIQRGASGQFLAADYDSRDVRWSWEGLLPNEIRPGQAFRLTVRAAAEILPPKSAESIYVEGQASIDVFLENVVPTLTVDPFQSPVVVKDPPGRFALEGSVDQANPAVYGIPGVRYRIGNGSLVNVPVSERRWRLELPPGDHAITLEAFDAFASVTTAQARIKVLRFQMPDPIDPATPQTLAGVPTTASINSWTRLEPQCSGADIGGSSSARLFDPLWLLARQWQIGEFQGEDTGSPVEAKVRAASALLTRSYFGELPWDNKAPPYDPTLVPLEALVERQRMRPADADDPRMLTLAVEAGLHFLRMLEQSAAGRKYRPAFLAQYPLQPPPEAPGDDPSRCFAATMAGRAPDARRLAAAFRIPGPPQIVFDPALNVTAADLPALQQIAAAWLAWYDGLFAEPGAPSQDAWVPERLEYAVSVAARMTAEPGDALTFSASEFDGGRLDWSSFDVNRHAILDTTGDQAPTALHEATIPAPVSFHGMPAPRFWEMEDAKIAYGLVSAGPTDLVQLLMIEYAGSYGNDWYVVPLTVPVGSVTGVDSLVVKDTFGVRSLLRPMGDPLLPKPYFSLWQPSILRRPGDEFGMALTTGERVGEPVPNRFFLPPTLGQVLDGETLEDVLFMRDEMANLAWGIERSLESAVEAPAKPGQSAPAQSPQPAPGAAPRYRLASAVPEHWIPLLPVPLEEPGKIGLKRGALLQPDASTRLAHARSEVLNALGVKPLYDEEVPREGARLTRRRRMARWTDGSTWVWTAFRNEVGTGEGTAGLRFDQLEGGGEP